MKIDKTRFILLTTTLAASTTAALVACTVNSTNNTTNTGDAGSSTSSSSGSSGQGTSSSGGTSSGATPDGSTPTACLGDTGEKAYCAPSVESTVDAGSQKPAQCVTQCESHNDWFKAAVARSIKECLDLLPTAEGCDTEAPNCANKAIDKACDDATATDWCTTNLKCPGGGTADAGGYGGGGNDPQAVCVKIVRGLTARGRDTLKACFETAGGVCAEGALEDCFEGLKVGQPGAP